MTQRPGYTPVRLETRDTWEPMWPAFFAGLSNPGFDSITQDVALEFREHGKHAGIEVSVNTT